MDNDVFLDKELPHRMNHAVARDALWEIIGRIASMLNAHDTPDSSA